jgi:hypothetical protein
LPCSVQVFPDEQLAVIPPFVPEHDHVNASSVSAVFVVEPIEHSFFPDPHDPSTGQVPLSSQDLCLEQLALSPPFDPAHVHVNNSSVSDGLVNVPVSHWFLSAPHVPTIGVPPPHEFVSSHVLALEQLALAPPLSDTHVHVKDVSVSVSPDTVPIEHEFFDVPQAASSGQLPCSSQDLGIEQLLSVPPSAPEHVQVKAVSVSV